MSLQLILGSSGSGKSHKLYKEIIDKSISHKDVNYLIVVPEQFTLQTQKEIVTKHPYNGTMNIDILSFLRLAHRVFEETGGNNRPVLEDTGKSMILRKVLAQSKDDLKFFGREAKKIGFVSELKSLISELFQYSVTKDDLERIGRDLEARPMLYNKLHDISVIYNGFREYLEEKYITQEEILDVLCDVISKSDLIKTSVIAFDGFTGFTPAQYKLLGLLMKLAKKVIVTVTIDEREDITSLGEEFELFHLSKKTIHNLYKIAEENNIKIDKPIYPDMANKGEVIRFRDNKALAFLERNLFRYPYKSYKKDQDQVRIHVAEDAKAEVSYVVRETQRLVRDEGYRYQDIAIITGDIGQYCNILEREFERANIPVFIDHKRELLNNPFVEMIRSMLDIVKNDFDYESVFRFLRCGLTDYSNDDLDILENYIIALGIRGKSRWEKEWKKTYRGQVEGELTRINEIREELVDFFTPISKILKDREKTVRDYTITIYDHIVKLNIAEKLEKYKQDFEAKNMFSTAKEYEQIYGIVIDLFEKLVELLGNEKLQLEEYIEILEAGFLEAKVGVIPPGLDQLVVGDIERTRLNKVKAVFFVGINDGIVPKNSGDGGILSDLDREVLLGSDLELAPTKRQVAYMERFYLYWIMTKPSEKLYLSYSKLDLEGNNIRPSYLIGVISKLFPSIEIIDEERLVEDEVNILGSDRGMDYLIKGIRKYPSGQVSDYWKELYSLYLKDEKLKKIIDNLISGAFFTNHEIGLKAEIAKDLYGNELLGSVTRFEQFASCPFAHYVKYGLNLQERVEYSLEALDIGNLFHDALEIFSKRLHNSGNDWENLSEEDQQAWVEESINEAANNPKNDIFSSSKRYEYIVNRSKRITNRTIWAIKKQITSGDFIPSHFEVYFTPDRNLSSLNIPLSQGGFVKLNGRIDRIDIYEDDNQVMVRVVDYKSGKTSFDLLSVYHGLQLQLAIYLNAATEFLNKSKKDKTIKPAGILYYHIDDPIVDKNADIEASILKELKMDGIVNEDVEVIIRLDNSFKEVYKIDSDTDEEDVEEEKEILRLKGGVSSSVIPVKTNKDGSLSKDSKVVSDEEVSAIEDYVTLVVKDFGEEILAGNTRVEPYQLNDLAACKYCPYNSVCGFDPKIEGFAYRKLSSLSDKEIWDEINNKLGKKDSGGNSISLNEDNEAYEDGKKGGKK